jgi:hypothetical protein
VKYLNKIMGVCALCLSTSAFSLDAWMSQGYKIAIIDSLAADNSVYLTLEGYVNESCSNNRVLLNHPDDRKFDKIFSLVLSAMHSGSGVKFYFSDTSNCNSNRIQLIK